MARAQKRTETAFWPLRIFSARMSAKTAGRKIATAFRRFAKQSRVSAQVKLALYGFLLRFKRCQMPSFSSLKSAVCGLFTRANPAKGISGCFGKPARMAV
jgi:hypothetical protein